jgi:serine O-acetyltransferase
MRLDDDIVENYRLSRAAYSRNALLAAESHYRYNRANHAIDLFYEIELPEHLMFVHPVGTVLGRATYGDFLCVYQNVGVGSDLDGNRPVLGDGVVLFPGAKVLGKTVISGNVFVMANAVMNGCYVPPNSVAYGYNQSSPTTRSVIRDVFKVKYV